VAFREMLRFSVWLQMNCLGTECGFLGCNAVNIAELAFTLPAIRRQLFLRNVGLSPNYTAVQPGYRTVFRPCKWRSIWHFESDPDA
jgi:hypothetical protein